jgi:hypothetical protein
MISQHSLVQWNHRARVAVVSKFANRVLQQSIVMSCWLAVFLTCSGTKAICHDHSSLSSSVSRSIAFEDHLRTFHPQLAPWENIQLGLHFHWQFLAGGGNTPALIADCFDSLSICHSSESNPGPRDLDDAELCRPFGLRSNFTAELRLPGKYSPSLVRLGGYVNAGHFLGNMRC